MCVLLTLNRLFYPTTGARIGAYSLRNSSAAFVRHDQQSVDMLFVVRRLQELGRERKIPLYMCFVDLQKAYDSVDRELLWQVLTRFGVPAKMHTVIRQF